MKLEPRAWQKVALERWNREGQGVVSVVTGGGKTAFALFVFDALRQADPNTQIVVVVPTIALLDQWVVAIASDGGIPQDNIATYSGESRSAEPQIASVVVIDTARSIIQDVVRSPNCLLVVDECHRAGAPQNARALDVEVEYTLGLSATPKRQYDDGFQRYVEPALGPVIFEYDYAAAHRDGVISDFILHNFRFPLSASEQRKHGSLSKRIDAFHSSRVRAVNDPYLDSLIEARSRLLADSRRRTVATIGVSQQLAGRQIVFHERIDPANTIARHLDQLGARVGIYHSKLAAGIRRRNLDLFRQGIFDRIVTCRALDEGLNVPDASVAVIGASTKSTRQRIQRLGRVLRPSAGKATADVATVYAAPEEEEFLRDEAASLSGVADSRWYSIDV